MRRFNRKGFTLVEIMIVVAIIGLLAAIAIPNFMRARTTTQMNACINNLRIIDAAIEQWALETNQVAGTIWAAANLDPYIKGGTVAVTCPADAAQTFATSYAIGLVGADPTCLIVPATHDLP